MKGIQELKAECEKRFGRRMVSPTDFNEFSRNIGTTTGDSISVSTIKRIWGYIPYTSKTSNTVLTVLAKYAGYKDWDDFRNSATVTDSSDFVRKDIIKSRELHRATHILLTWKPDRCCTVEYLGESRYRVVEAENCKLQVGDIFICEVMAAKEALVCHDLTRDGKELAEVYVAGKTDGLSAIRIIDTASRQK